MSIRSWERKECDGCKFFNPECRQGACSRYPYKKKKIANEKEKGDDTD